MQCWHLLVPSLQQATVVSFSLRFRNCQNLDLTICHRGKRICEQPRRVISPLWVVILLGGNLLPNFGIGVQTCSLRGYLHGDDRIRTNSLSMYVAVFFHSGVNAENNVHRSSTSFERVTLAKVITQVIRIGQIDKSKQWFSKKMIYLLLLSQGIKLKYGG